MRLIGCKTRINKVAAVSLFTGSLILGDFGMMTGFRITGNGEAHTVYGAEAEEQTQTEQAAAQETETESAPVRISWWICPTGGFKDEDKVEELTELFEAANPEVDVEFRILDEYKGDEEIRPSLGTEDAPNVVLAAPEKIVTQWGGEGYMADLSELWDEETQEQFRAEMRETAQNREGVWYSVPLYRNVFSMAINYEAFKTAGALQYLAEDVHTWKDSGFIDSVLRIHDYLEQQGESDSVVGKVYYKDEIGQREFMSFVSNFFNTCVVDEYHSAYQMTKGKIRDVFSTLRRLEGKGIEFVGDMNGVDENEAFLNGDVLMTFNWDAEKQIKAEKTADFTPYPMMYPNSKNLPVMTGTVGSLGVVDSGNQELNDAAMSLVSFLMKDPDAYRQAVTTSGCFPARKMLDGHDISRTLYQGDPTMELYESFNEYYGDYYPMMELFDQFEQKWMEMMPRIAQGEKVKKVMKELFTPLNTELVERYHIAEVDMDEAE